MFVPNQGVRPLHLELSLAPRCTFGEDGSKAVLGVVVGIDGFGVELGKSFYETGGVCVLIATGGNAA